MKVRKSISIKLEGGISAMTLSKNSKYLVTGCTLGYIRLWQPKSLDCIGTFEQAHSRKYTQTSNLKIKYPLYVLLPTDLSSLVDLRMELSSFGILPFQNVSPYSTQLISVESH
jgi:hypothetical protein